MSVSTSKQSSLTSPAILIVTAGVFVALVAWMLPANLKSLSPTLLQAAGAGTPTLGSYGRDLVDLEKNTPISRAWLRTSCRSSIPPRSSPTRPTGWRAT